MRRSIEIRNGLVSKVVLLFVASVLLVIGLVLLGLKIRPDAKQVQTKSAVRVYCASGLVLPIEQIVAQYNDEFGKSIEIARTGGSGELAGQIKTEFETGLVGGADIYITADHTLLVNAFSEGIVSESFPLAVQKPVIAVAVNSKLEFDNLSELVSAANIKYGIASERSAIGKMVREIAKREGVLQELESNKATDSENVMTLAQALVTGSLDAAVVWDTTVSQINQSNHNAESSLLRFTLIADPSNEFQGSIAIGIVAATKSSTECISFVRYLTAPEKSRTVFENYGYTFIEGNAWEKNH